VFHNILNFIAISRTSTTLVTCLKMRMMLMIFVIKYHHEAK